MKGSCIRAFVVNGYTGAQFAILAEPVVNVHDGVIDLVKRILRATYRSFGAVNGDLSIEINAFRYSW